MSASELRLPIAPKAAVAKFLVDMRLTAERGWRRWHAVFADALSERGLTPAARRQILDLHPIEDFYFAGLVALQAYRIREVFPTLVGEALMREIALQLDPAVGRSDSTISNVAFIILGRVRKAREAGNGCNHDQAVETILERIGIPLHEKTRSVMTCLATRHKLAEPLALAAPEWWDAFTGIYLVDVSTLPANPRRASVVGPYGLGVERLRGIQRATQPPATTGGFSFAAWLAGSKSEHAQHPD